MYRYDTEKTVTRIEFKNNCDNSVSMEVTFYNSIDGEFLSRTRISIPKDMAKSKFTDVGITRHIMNFFVKG